jgi:hypothetical protein
MFDIKAFNDINIHEFAVHTLKTDWEKIEVYFKPGSQRGYQHSPNQWTRLGETVIKGQGLGHKSTLPNSLFQPVQVNAYEKVAFYITSTSSASMRTSIGSYVGNTVVRNNDLKIMEGVSLNYPFGALSAPRVWNGILHYSLVKENSNQANVAARSPFISPVTNAVPIMESSISPTVSSSFWEEKEKDEEGGEEEGSVVNNWNALTTDFAGFETVSSIMFDTFGKKDITVLSMSIHLQSMDEKQIIDIYTKKGSHEGYELDSDSWIPIGSLLVSGGGIGIPTHLPDAFSPINIKSGKIQSFYIVSNFKKIISSRGSFVGNLASMNPDMELFEGTSLDDKFVRHSQHSFPQIWNGVIYYELES